MRVALVQDAPVAFDRVASLEKALGLLEDAAAQGAELVVFPEAFLGGYPKGIDFGVRVGVRSPEGRDWFRRYAQGALSLPGPETEALGRAAKRLGLHVVIGVIERAGGTLYCAVLFFGGDGALLGKRRKLVPTAMERVIWGAGDGSTVEVFGTPLGRIGAAICWENYMPLLRTALYAQGIQFYCGPTVDDRETWIPTVRHIALEGRCFVLSCCQFACRSDFPDDYPLKPEVPPDTVLIRGGSCIVSPLGELLAGPRYGERCLLTADLDPDDILRGNLDMDAVGHYARPDVFRLTVNTAPANGVIVEEPARYDL